ncbi:MAG TPA: GNAT family N-acetyltransferase [Candidatus Dormibacteraeota bacterium]|nr:GNAT family N-acetyltransferase [Candidatus Dormibacteraeota bacterium]
MTMSIAASLPFAFMRVRRLENADGPAVLRLLDGDPIQNVYLRSELRLGALRSGQWWGAIDSAGLEGVMVGGALVVPWVPTEAGARSLAIQLANQAPPRMIVGPRLQVAALQAARLPPAPKPREVRDPQPLLALRRGELLAQPAATVRLGTRADLEPLVLAAAAMHREEMGVDPMLVDPSGWRFRMATLVDRGWSFVWMMDGRVVFKAELSAWTPDVCQVQGVWTAPGHRGQGIGTQGMAAVCEAALEQTPTCSLYVNHFNLPARRLYERLGFAQVAEFATYLL